VLSALAQTPNLRIRLSSNRDNWRQMLSISKGRSGFGLSYYSVGEIPPEQVCVQGRACRRQGAHGGRGLPDQAGSAEAAFARNLPDGGRGQSMADNGACVKCLRCLRPKRGEYKVLGRKSGVLRGLCDTKKEVGRPKRQAFLAEPGLLAHMEVEHGTRRTRHADRGIGDVISAYTRAQAIRRAC